MIVLLLNLLMASIMMVTTVLIHFFGIILLLRFISSQHRHVERSHSILRQCVLLISAVLGVVCLHTIEIWAYAMVYLALGALRGLEPALYFSTVSFVSVGYGDLVLGPHWRLFGAIEAANGVILFAWSTAFLISVMGKLRALEHEWLER